MSKILYVRTIIHLDNEIVMEGGETEAEAVDRFKDQMEDNDDLLELVNKVCEESGPEHLALADVEVMD